MIEEHLKAMILSVVDDLKQVTIEINDPQKIEFYKNHQDFIRGQFKIMKV
jgi:hypothetical protein